MSDMLGFFVGVIVWGFIPLIVIGSIVSLFTAKPAHREDSPNDVLSLILTLFLAGFFSSGD
jgi:hypothetical protein